MTLPFNVERCAGAGYRNDDGTTDWREGCETCLRRTSPPDTRGQYCMTPPEIIVFECPFLIEPNNKYTKDPM